MGYMNCMYTNDYEDTIDVELVNSSESNKCQNESNLTQEEIDAIKE